MKRGFLILWLGIFLVVCQKTMGQTKEIKIALLSSFYLDTHFDLQGKTINEKGISKQAISSLEFYEGAVMAIDSLNNEGVKIKMQAFDIQSKTGNLDTLIQSGSLNSFHLIIGNIIGSDYLKTAAFSKGKNIPFVSATYPNDGGIRESPTVFLANPKINSHLLLIYNQVTKKWPQSKIIWIQSSDSADNKLTELFDGIYQSDVSKKIQLNKTIAKKQFTAHDLETLIDTTKKENVFIVGSLNESFMIQFAKALNAYPKKGFIQVVGLPVWETFKEVQNKEYNGIPIYYSSSFYIPTQHKWHSEFDVQYKNSMGAKVPSLASKAFELVYYFTHLLNANGNGSIVPDSTDQRYKMLTDFDFRPVRWSSKSSVPDYYENKRIYFLRRLNGVTTVQ
jgi:ABC-type branched-subunit amino acid transport system substrate-binding protein